MAEKEKKPSKTTEQRTSAHTRILTVTLTRFVRFLVCAKAEVMTKPDSSVFLLTSTAQSAHLIICFFLSNSSLWQLNSWEPLSYLACDALLFWSHLPAQGLFPEHGCHGRDLPGTSTGHPNTLVMQAVKSQTHQSSQRLDLGLSGCWEPSPYHVLALEFELLIDLLGHCKSGLKKTTKCHSVFFCHFPSLTADCDGIICYC